MLAAFDIYINYIKDPKDDELVGMKFLKANIYRRYNHFDEAIPLFLDILDKHREHETAEYSANLLLDTYNRMKKYDEMLALVEKLDCGPEVPRGQGRPQADAEQDQGAVDAQEGGEARDGRQGVEGLRQVRRCAARPTSTSTTATRRRRRTTRSSTTPAFASRRASRSAPRSQTFNLLQKYYPNSKLTAKAIARLGKAYGDIAFYDKASEKLEEYAKKYAGEKDAYDAMSDAVFYRKGIGDDAKAIEDTKYFIKTFGTKKPQEAANAMFSLTTIYEKQGDKDAVDQAPPRVHPHVRQQGWRRPLVIANAKIGQILWEQICPVKQVDGSCVKIVRERAIGT